MQLYQRLLGASFDRLPPALRSFHAQGGGEAECTFQVRRGAGAFRAAAARILAFPRPAARVSVALRVRVSGEREIWTRAFPGHELRTVQSLERGRLVERAGPVRIAFDVDADETGMRFTSREFRVLGVRLWRALAPQVTARVRGAANGWNVDVSVALPLLGTIASYGGTVMPADRDAAAAVVTA